MEMENSGHSDARNVRLCEISCFAKSGRVVVQHMLDQARRQGSAKVGRAYPVSWKMKVLNFARIWFRGPQGQDLESVQC